LEQIDEIFDKLETEEGKSLLMILFSLPNLSLLAVSVLAVYKWMELQRLGGKSRRD
jgi:hypothetical protein